MINVIGVPSFSEGGAGPIKRSAGRPHMGGVPMLPPVGKYWNIGFQTELKAPATKGTAVELSALLQSAGLTEALVPATSSTYSMTADPLAAASDQSVSLLAETTLDGDSFSSYGARFGFSIGGEAGKQVLVDWTGIGAYIRPAALAALTGWTENAGTPMEYLGDSNPCRIHSYDMILRSWKINWHLEPQARPSLGGSAAHGYHKWPALLVPAAENPSFEFVVECEDETAFARWTKYEAATSAAGSIILVAGTHTCTISMAAMQFDKPATTFAVPNTQTLTGIMSGSSALSIAWT